MFQVSPVPVRIVQVDGLARSPPGGDDGGAGLRDEFPRRGGRHALAEIVSGHGLNPALQFQRLPFEVFVPLGLREHFNAFLNVISRDTKILDLPLAAERYRVHCVEHGTHRAFNLVRSILQAFLNSSFGRHHALWQQVSNIKPLKTEPKRNKRILTPGEFLHLHDELCIMKANVHADMAEAMVLTGMNFGEYASENWEVLADRVVIHGTKRASRARVVPRLHNSYSPPQRGYKAFRLALKKASENMDEYILKASFPHVTTHSLRATFSHWLEMAQIPRSRRLSYLGHSGGDTLGKHYERHELDSYLLEDAKRVRDYIREALEDHRTAWKARIDTLVTGKVAEYFQQRERDSVDSIWMLESDSEPEDPRA